jgi:thiol-disulfide isomerase/thioredoxin
VKRNVLVMVMMLVGIGLVVWAGWHNLRERRRLMEERQNEQVILVPDASGPSPSSEGGAASGAGSAATYGQASPLRDKPAPAFTLVDLDGKKVSLSEYKGRPVVVNFWATWCAPCKVEMPWFQEFRQKYASDGLEVLGITDDADAGKAAIEKVTKRTGVTYPILLGDGKVDDTYGGLDVLPMSFYVDKGGKVVEVTAGLGSKDELEAMVKEAISGSKTLGSKN